MNPFVKRIKSWGRFGERALIVSGSVLIVTWGGGSIAGRVQARYETAAVQRALAASTAQTRTANPASHEPIGDTWDGSEPRPPSHPDARDARLGSRIGLVEIPAIELSVVLSNGTDAWTLNRAVGRIEGTGHLGQPGNLGIAGHRDSFFRRLGELTPGDRIRVSSESGRFEYVVERAWVVDPTEVGVLADVGDASVITLVTCYPFYYLGRAPKRYIVRAALAN